MPHIIAEYSANLEDRLDVAARVADLHQAAIDSAVAELLGIRIRAVALALTPYPLRAPLSHTRSGKRVCCRARRPTHLI